ncbi:pentapeptide repeat-containing protein [Liquorilactobacillus satsumensis]|uniref:pentapeptide repeat-containing protein n=1 Tax=Liquorilactobacillus satsumensis TaxID=259059 RepID=UPI0021C40672|nr:pentapeptide repeat-containing protein [Liquorilactobacillus satsumensis]MCP9357978.1 pentapeptide repeat-containing protein [Liquorilactobacillus satsumensis]MCP9371795.1 pentapeptide repeat-containing protein [Liquorilactobacillus satsumensis]
MNKILELHQKWNNSKDGGVRADLRGTNLQYADLQYADLQYADLQYTDLRDTNLRDANLRGTNLQYADLQYADLQYADLQYADLQYTDLQYADLEYTDLRDANLRGTNLRGADLRGADLKWINWHETYGIKVYVAGLQSSRENAQLTYLPSLDIVTTGCFQDTWKALKERVKDVYKEDNPLIYKKYQLAINYIEAQIEADKDESK